MECFPGHLKGYSSQLEGALVQAPMKGDLSGDNVLFYSLKECPPALSVGIQVNEHKRPWIWFPDQLPFFVKADRVQDLTFFCPESAKIYADCIEENVSIRLKPDPSLPRFGDDDELARCQPSTAEAADEPLDS